jgi:hypothetical protein
VRLYLIFTNINCQLNAYTDKLSRIAFQYFFHIHTCSIWKDTDGAVADSNIWHGVF